MGRPMAANLAKAGHEVTTWNRTSGRNAEGTRAAATPRVAAQDAEVVWMCVSDTAAVERLLFGPDGVEAALRPGMLVVDSSTISPAATRRFAERVQAKGADYVDAPVTGSKVGAQNAQLIFICGGPQAAFPRLQPLFSAMGKKFVRVGETAMGQSAKLAMNLQIAVIYQGFAEAMTLAAKLGVPYQPLMELVNASMIRSGVVEYKAPFVEKRDFSANFPLRLMHKDIHLMLEAAQQAGIRLPALETVDAIYEQASREGYDDLDYAATLLSLEKAAGIEAPAT